MAEKRGAQGPPFLKLDKPKSHGVEQQVGEETVPLDQDPGGQGEPDGGNHWSGGEEFLHGSLMGGMLWRSARGDGHFVVVLQQLSAGELTEGSQWPGRGSKKALESNAEVDLNFIHRGVLAPGCLQVFLSLIHI